MSANGKQLEGLVAFVEKTMLPQGFEVKTNERVFNDEGIQIAEFDIEIRGKIGSTNITWLIECRDRPGHGPAPGSWIEQLVGRRVRFGFNKVTAVSTTGFAAGAVDFARPQGIELREVRSLSPDEFSKWLVLKGLHYVEYHTKLEHASVILDSNESPERLEAVQNVLASADGNAKILRSTKTNMLYSLTNAFLGAVNSQKKLFDGIEPNGPGRSITLHIQYVDDTNRFVLDTELGMVQIQEIICQGELVVMESMVPISVTAEYRHTETGEPISQVALFAPQQVEGLKFSLEMHRLANTGEMHLVMRKLRNDA